MDVHILHSHQLLSTQGLLLALSAFVLLFALASARSSATLFGHVDLPESNGLPSHMADLVQRRQLLASGGYGSYGRYGGYGGYGSYGFGRR